MNQTARVECGKITDLFYLASSLNDRAYANADVA